MISLAGLPCNEIEELIAPLPRFRAKQIYKWIIRGVQSFEEMTDLPNNLRMQLSQKFKFYSSTIENVHDDTDTKKIVISLHDNSKIEAVLLNDGKERYTACLSTQVGCPACCVFCKTGTLGFKRNLTSAEIIEQFLHINSSANFVPLRLGEREFVNNIVIMGMGEPLLNIAELRKAIDFFTDKQGLNISRKKITVSTCGISEGITDLANNGPYIRLAFSLLTGCEELRQKLMPLAKTNPLNKIKESLILFQKASGSRITLEIPLLGGINTRKEDAESIINFANGLDCVVNIIPWNPVNNLKFENKKLIEPDKKETEDFIKSLENAKINVTKRYKKGRSINGACGQLGSIGN